MKNNLFKSFCYCIISTITIATVSAQTLYSTDLESRTPPTEGQIQQGSNKSMDGHTFTVNSYYYKKDGKPWLPVMGEIHYTRIPRSEWEEAILKMKACGIDVIATYVFWIYHEEKQGVYNWKENRDLRAFIELCKKHHIYVWLRIGPWCHGEVRNGGFPDWLLKIKGGTRKDNPDYITEVKKYFNEIGQQTKGLCFKDNGPIIGVQIENEYAFKEDVQLAHLLNLKRIAITSGLDVPFYTATGWPSSNQEQRELIPVWGGYPEAPWDHSTKELSLSRNYLFSSIANDPSLGIDLLGKQKDADISNYQFPFSTAELGGGNEPTYHRRPLISSDDVTALSYVRIGCGANLVGYYMFRGGANLIGKYSTLQESRATHYPNDYPIISYDFLSPIGEWGELRDSYRNFKTLHYFLNDFGDRLATYYPNFPDKKCADTKDNNTLRMSVRAKNNSGFIFISNYQRLLKMKTIKDIKFHINLSNGQQLEFPKTPISIAPDEQMILPFGLEMSGSILKYATAQPICILKNENPTYVFFSHPYTRPEFAFSTKHIKQINLDNSGISAKQDEYLLQCSPEKPHLIEISLTNGKQIKVLVLTKEQAKNCWKLEEKGNEYLCITSSEIIPYNKTFIVRNKEKNKSDLYFYPEIKHLKILNQQNGTSVSLKKQSGPFVCYQLSTSKVTLPLTFSAIKNPTAFIPRLAVLPEDNRAANVPDSCPGPQYFVNFKPSASSLHYQINIPALPKGISNAFLKIDYTGDTGSLYKNGELIDDNYFNGEPMSIALNHFVGNKAQRFLFQIVPYRPQLKIYLSPKAKKELSVKNINNVKFVKIEAQYDIKIQINND